MPQDDSGQKETSRKVDIRDYPETHGSAHAKDERRKT
jgi:hypothetical protein